MIKILKNIIIGFLLLSIQVSVIAETHIVKMISTDPSDSTVAMAFVPPILKINKGDKVIFEPTQIGHNSASKRGMIPEGAKTWNSKLDEKIEIVYDIEGTYGYVCVPHYDMGMVGLILVGDYTKNLKTASKVRHRGKAKKAFRTLFKKAEELAEYKK